MSSDKVRLISFYLPQFHPIPENDDWWGKGFTEWTNVAKARPLFKGHHQPHVPADLGFYDLRLPEARQAQADLAREYGIHGFCYYHYWFNGKRVLHRPLDEVLDSGKPDFPFCLCWANEDWTRAWDGHTGIKLLHQQYCPEDDLKHIKWLIESVFEDARYIRVEGKPLFLVYRAGQFPDPRRTTEIWREEALRAGIGELYLCCVESLPKEKNRAPSKLGFDAAVDFQPDWTRLGWPLRRNPIWKTARALGLTSSAFGHHKIYEYEKFVRRMMRKPAPPYLRFPCVTPRWDNSPRRQKDAVVLRNCYPEIYREWLETAIKQTRMQAGEDLVFINAWNEWAEGSHLEPDLKYGRAYLEATRAALTARFLPSIGQEK